MSDKGSASDVASASSALKRRAAELLDFDTEKLIQSSAQPREVRFNHVQWLYSGNISLLGSITIGDDTLGLYVVVQEFTC